MKAKIIMVPGPVKEVEFNTPTSVLDLCIKNNLTDLQLTAKTFPYKTVVLHGIGKSNDKVTRCDDINQLVNDGDRVILGGKPKAFGPEGR